MYCAAYVMRLSDTEAALARERSAAMVGATIRRSGDDLWGCCPFHSDKTPSFHVDSRGYFCFGCHQHGDHADLVMRHRGCSFKEALAELGLKGDGSNRPPAKKQASTQATERMVLAREVTAALRIATYTDGYDTPKHSEAVLELRQKLQPLMPKFHFSRLLRDLGLADGSAQVTDDMPTYEHTVRYRTEPGPWQVAPRHAERPELESIASQIALQRPGSPEDAYFHARGLSDATIATYGLGPLPHDALIPEEPDGSMYRWQGRAMLPIQSYRGKVVGFAGRVMRKSEKQKYLNSHFRKGDHLYGLDVAGTAAIHAHALIVVEGYADVWAMHEAGIEHCAAIMGTSVTTEQAQLMRPYATYMVLDGDPAGRSALLRSFPRLLTEGVWPLSVTLPDGADPDDILRTEGKAGMLARIAGATPLYAEWAATVDAGEARRTLGMVKDPWVVTLLGEDLSKRFGAATRTATPDTIGGYRRRVQAV